jgi:hypothetical protein
VAFCADCRHLVLELPEGGSILAPVDFRISGASIGPVQGTLRCEMWSTDLAREAGYAAGSMHGPARMAEIIWHERTCDQHIAIS